MVLKSIILGLLISLSTFSFCQDFKIIEGDTNYFRSYGTSFGNISFNWFKKGLDNGNYQVYDSTNTYLLYTCTLTDNFLEGKFIYFYPVGRKQFEGQFSRGGKYEAWVYYYENGNKEYECYYSRKRELAGDYFVYYKDGTLKVKGTHGHDRKHGRHTYYYPSGRVEAEGAYSFGAKYSKWRFYYESGELKEVGYFGQNEKREGKWIFYNEQGEKVKTENYGIQKVKRKRRKKSEKDD